MLMDSLEKQQKYSNLRGEGKNTITVKAKFK